jgi:hypothetical protein
MHTIESLPLDEIQHTIQNISDANREGKRHRVHHRGKSPHPRPAARFRTAYRASDQPAHFLIFFSAGPPPSSCFLSISQYTPTRGTPGKAQIEITSGSNG